MPEGAGKPAPFAIPKPTKGETMKLTKDITGCAGGEIMPRVYEAGSECPDDLIAAALELGALDKKGTAKADAARAAQEEADRKAAEEAEAARADHEHGSGHPSNRPGCPYRESHGSVAHHG